MSFDYRRLVIHAVAQSTSRKTAMAARKVIANTTFVKGVVDRKPEPGLSGTIECDELYQVAGHKGHPDAVKNPGRKGSSDQNHTGVSRHNFEVWESSID